MKNNNSDWKLLQQLMPHKEKKDALRERILHSIRDEESRSPSRKIIDWKPIVLTGLFLIFSGGIILQLIDGASFKQQQTSSPEPSTYSEKVGGSFTWAPELVDSRQSKEGQRLYPKNSAEQAGYIQEVSEKEMKKFVSTTPISLKKNLDHMPYPTIMFIEHVKMMDISLRYHFFVEAGKRIFHFSMDYPRLDYSEIFHIIGTLSYSEEKPLIHKEPAYVTYGYDDLPYPIGISRSGQSGDTVHYVWEGATSDQYQLYIKKIKETGRNEIKSSKGTHTFESDLGSEIVTISLEGKDLSFTFSYPDREE